MTLPLHQDYSETEHIQCVCVYLKGSPENLRGCALDEVRDSQTQLSSVAHAV